MLMLVPVSRYVTTPELNDAPLRILTEFPFISPFPDDADAVDTAEAVEVCVMVVVFEADDAAVDVVFLTSVSLTFIFLSVLETRSDRI